MFNVAFELLQQWLNVEESNEIQPLGNAAVYKTSVVIWLMLFQRLNPDASLKDAVEYFFVNAPKGKQANRRLSEGTLSTGTGSYSDARKRLSIDIVNWFQRRLSDSISESTLPSLLPEVGAMYGDNAIGETKLAEPLIGRLPAGSILMADSGFGIFSIANRANANGHNFVLRMTRSL